MFKARAAPECLRTSLNVSPGAELTTRKKNLILKDIMSTGRLLFSFGCE